MRGTQYKFGIIILIVYTEDLKYDYVVESKCPATNPEVFTAEEKSKAPVQQNNIINIALKPSSKSRQYY